MMKTLQIPVSEVMTRDLHIVRPKDSLERIHEIFSANAIHHIPVITEDGVLKGIVSLTDFKRVNHMLSLFNKDKYESLNYKLYRSMTAQEIMTKELATLNSNDKLQTAADIFRENIFHALPVCDEGILVGMVTTHDVLTYCCSEQAYLE